MKKKTKDTLIAFLFLLPFMLVFIIFLAYPVIYSLILSLHKVTVYTDLYDIFSDMKFVGFENYVKLILDNKFWWSLVTSLAYGLFTIPTGIFLSLILAVVLNNKFKGNSFFRSSYFLPNVLDVYVVGLIWTLLLAPKYGLIDQFLNNIGIQFFSEKGFLGNPSIALFTIALVMVLKGCGFGMILFLTAIQNIPESVYEAADIDGASWFHKLRFITIPLVKPIIFFMATVGIIGALNTFTEIYAMTNASGGPDFVVKNIPFFIGTTQGATKVSGFYLYQNFNIGKYGYSAAISYLLLIVGLIISMINRKIIGSSE
ncbi:MAG: sugar ABC transporter permease [bacterium]|nr:sugar ABC transporter permease [bacterium]